MKEAREKLAACVQNKCNELDLSGLKIEPDGAREVAARLPEW